MTAPALPTSAPALGEAPRVRRLTPPVLLAAGVLVLSLALHLRDPHRSGSWGFCPWLALTGMSCPGCGGLRAVHHLTDGDLLAAASSNLLLVGSLPVAAVLWLRSLRARWEGVHRPVPPRLLRRAALAALVLVTIFTVLRNIPTGAWLAP